MSEGIPDCFKVVFVDSIKKKDLVKIRKICRIKGSTFYPFGFESNVMQTKTELIKMAENGNLKYDLLYNEDNKVIYYDK